MLLPLGSISLCGDTVFITSVLVSYRSAALDEKTPILPANATSINVEAVSSSTSIWTLPVEFKPNWSETGEFLRSP
jgi:hypothetical protein